MWHYGNCTETAEKSCTLSFLDVTMSHSSNCSLTISINKYSASFIQEIHFTPTQSIDFLQRCNRTCSLVAYEGNL